MVRSEFLDSPCSENACQLILLIYVGLSGNTSVLSLALP